MKTFYQILHSNIPTARFISTKLNFLSVYNDVILIVKILNDMHTMSKLGLRTQSWCIQRCLGNGVFFKCSIKWINLIIMLHFHQFSKFPFCHYFFANSIDRWRENLHENAVPSQNQNFIAIKLYPRPQITNFLILFRVPNQINANIWINIPKGNSLNINRPWLGNLVFTLFCVPSIWMTSFPVPRKNSSVSWSDEI